ncbi:histidine phosphatase superfamily, partial [Endogone sp. FLAS-F59071]
SAQTLADHLFNTTSISPILIYTSPFLRATETASILHSVLTAAAPVPHIIPTPITTPTLSERFFGYFELCSPSDSIYASVWAEDAQDGYHTRWNVESCVSVRDRTASLVQNIVEPSVAAHAIILVAHGDALQILQTAFEDVPVEQHRSLRHVETAEWREMRSEG